MKKYQYKCTLLTDVIITSEAATEGYSPSLDYIPGSKILGIVAGKLYDENNENKTLDLFHNGTVCYGDANLYISNSEYLATPFSWYIEKGKSLLDDIYIHHLLQTSDKQLKQVRSGYYSSETNKTVKLEQAFSLKSAQDATTRRSEDGKMFGYHSLKAGSEWVFEISDQSGKYTEDIKNVIIGKHRVGRSRTAEFGLVEIEFLKEIKEKEKKVYSNEIVIYAKSNLCFLNEHGIYTAQPTAEQLCGDKGAKILWDKSQIRTRNYKTWNRKRNNKDADRVIIERGSVFVIKSSSDIDSSFYENGIGNHRAEGFGQVLVNPKFLKSDSEKLNYRLEKQDLNLFQKSIVEKGVNDSLIFEVLSNNYTRNDLDAQIDKKVNDFVRRNESLYRGLSKSQWGVLRNYGKHLSKKDDFLNMVFDKENGFVYTGQSENDWRQKGRRITLENYLESLSKEEFFPFVIKLSSQMSKK